MKLYPETLDLNFIDVPRMAFTNITAISVETGSAILAWV